MQSVCACAISFKLSYCTAMLFISIRVLSSMLQTMQQTALSALPSVLLLPLALGCGDWGRRMETSQEHQSPSPDRASAARSPDQQIITFTAFLSLIPFAIPIRCLLHNLSS